MANGVGEHATPSLFLLQPAFILPCAGGPTPSCLYYPAPTCSSRVRCHDVQEQVADIHQ
jgi:hypothetical protein